MEDLYYKSKKGSVLKDEEWVDQALAQILDHLEAEALKYIWYSERDDEFYITKTDLTSILEKEKE